MRTKIVRTLVVFIPLCSLLALLVFFTPPVHERVAWRIETLRAQIHRYLNPPQEVVFIPQQQTVLEEQIASIVSATLFAVEPTPIATPSPASLPTSIEASLTSTTVPDPTLAPAPTSTPLPEKVSLSGIHYDWQSFNNCGPANLAMALSFWGWEGDQRDTQAVLRPDKDDYNVMPEEMVAFVETQTNLRAKLRVGGDRQLLKRFIAAGFPVLIEMGHDPEDDDWMGHYLVVSGYDDVSGIFITQDSLIMADYPLPYPEIHSWHDFNTTFLIIYPPEREGEVLAILDLLSDPLESHRIALHKAEADLASLTGRDLFFAWYNKGTNLVALEDYAMAAEAYDRAFALYAALPEEERPWRLLWYQNGPYAAYYHTGRYQDVINLATTTLSVFSKRALEETHYWRGLAWEAQGNTEKAIFDWQIAVELNPNFILARDALQRLGVPIP